MAFKPAFQDTGGGGEGGGLTPAQEAKLNSVQFGATANQADAFLLARANHTGEQPIGSVTGLDVALESKVDKVADKQLSTEDYTTAEKEKLNSVQFEATKNQTDAFLLDRANHTGEQPINTVAGLQLLLDQLSEQGMTAAELARLVAVEDTLPTKADLEGGKLALDQMPDIAAGRKITVADEAARLALDVWPDLTIAYQADNGNAYAIDANSDPSSTGNWSLLGSGIASGVTSFNARTGVVLPQVGDYNTDQITETAEKQFVSAADKAEWTAKETVVGAQAKALAAETAAKAYADLTFIEKNQKGVANGIATLSESGELTESQLPLKTINGESIRGTGNIVIEGGGEVEEAPTDGKQYARQLEGWTEVAPTNLSLGTRTTTAVPVNSSTGANVTLPAATTSLAGVMTSADKTKLNSVEAGATNIPRITGTLTVTVGSGGTYPTISAAIDDLIQRKKTNRQLLTTIRVLSGFVINEQIIVRNTDLSWITLTSNNDLVTSTFAPSTYLGTDFGYGSGFQPVFGVANGKLPLFYQFNYEADASNWGTWGALIAVLAGGYFSATRSRFVGTGANSLASRFFHVNMGEAVLFDAEVRRGGGLPMSVSIITNSNLRARNCNFRAAGSTTNTANDLMVNNNSSFSGNLVHLTSCLGGTSITPNIINNGSLILSN